MKMLKQIVDRIKGWFRFRYALSRISLKDGDVLVFRDKGDCLIPDSWRLLDGMRDFLDRNNFKNVTIMYLFKDSELQGASEKEMNRAGWFRTGSQDKLSISEMNENLLNGRHYLMGVRPEDLTVEDALEAFGFNRNGLWQ